MALTDWELWACAIRVEQEHGYHAPGHIFERLEALAAAGDEEGVTTWLSIADRVGQLDRGSARLC